MMHFIRYRGQEKIDLRYVHKIKLWQENTVYGIDFCNNGIKEDMIYWEFNNKKERDYVYTCILSNLDYTIPTFIPSNLI